MEYTCNICGTLTRDPEYDKENKKLIHFEDSWSMIFITWNEKKACFCNKCYKYIYNDWKMKDDD